MLSSWGARPIEAVRLADRNLNNLPGSPNRVRIVRLKALLYSLPLGWRLSGGTIFLMEAEDPVPGQCRDGTKEDSTLRFDADCLLRDLQSELL